MTPHQLYPPNQSNPIQHRGKEKIGGKDGSWQVTLSRRSRKNPEVGFGWKDGSIIIAFKPPWLVYGICTDRSMENG